MYTKRFRVIAVSSNANSFGLNQVVMIATDGEAYKACRYLGIHPITKGQDLSIPLDEPMMKPNFIKAGFEIPEQIEKAPAKLIKEIFAE